MMKMLTALLLSLLTRSDALIGYFQNLTLLRVTCQ